MPVCFQLYRTYTKVFKWIFSVLRSRSASFTFWLHSAILRCYCSDMIPTDGIKSGASFWWCLCTQGKQFCSQTPTHCHWTSSQLTFRLSRLITNILLQLVLGVFLEIVHSWLPIATIYFSSVIGGSLFVTLLNPNSYAVGASAGVYGLLASHLSSIILDWNDWNRKIVRLSMVVIYIVLDFYVNWNFAPDDLDVRFYHKPTILMGIEIDVSLYSNRLITQAMWVVQ